MNGKYSLPVVKAVDLIWTSFDKEEIHRGYAMLMQAAQQGDADALCFIARCFMGEEYVWSGAGFATDDASASKLMQKSALMGSATGVLCAARSGNFTPAVQRGMPFESFKDAFEEILEQAERGNAFCCYMIGNVYYWGDYLLVDPEFAKQFKTEDNYNAWAYPIAKEWFERSFNGRICAGWGNYCNIRKSGLCDIRQEVFEVYFQALAEISPVICGNYGYYLGHEKNNPEAALAYYIKAAHRYDIQSTFNAGCCYDEGFGVERDVDMAFNFYEIAAIGGHPNAQWQAGYYYFDGWGSVEQDYAKAAEWFEKAYQNPQSDDRNRVRSAAYLGICYQDGLGVIQDDDLALEYLQEAEENIDMLWNPINAMVLNALGVAYYFGRGTEEDEELGYEYFEDAAKLGLEVAKEHLQQINQPGMSEHESHKPGKEIAPFYQGLAERIREAVEKDLREVLDQVGEEQIYTAALVSDRDCVTLFLAVNTVEYLNENDGPDSESKWIPDEWGYSDGHHSALVKLSRLLWEHHDELPSESYFFNAVISAMKQLKDAKAFGDCSEEITCFVSISDDEEAGHMEDLSAKQLNSAELVAAFLKRDS